MSDLLADLLKDLQRGVILWQLCVIAIALLVAWQIATRTQRRFIVSGDSDPTATLRLSVGGTSRLVFPLSALILLLAGRWVLSVLAVPTNLLKIAVPLMLAMLTIRAVVYLLRHTFAPGGALRSWEVMVTWLVWAMVALYITGWLPDIAQFLDETGFGIGRQRISLAMILSACLTVVLTVLVALWLGRFLETRIMSLGQMEIHLRVAFTKIIRTILVVIAVLIALPIVGIDITVLSVFGGAMGVGLGFGLQKIVANYISGFTILLDRTVSPGDLVTVDSFYGEVTKLTSRCIIVRSPEGTEAIVPNETVVTSTLINHSYSNRRVLMRIPVQVGYSSDIDAVLALMVEIARNHTRVLKDPAPMALLTSFGDSGINLELMTWIEDPERGKLNLQSELNLEIFRAFRARGIEFPFPQRDIRIIGPRPEAEERRQ
jgi:small-conductance mechanosensitive channel